MQIPRRRFLRNLLGCTVLLGGPLAAFAADDTFPAKVVQEIEKIVGSEYSALDGLYKHFHANPELSLREEKTAARLAAELRHVGLEVTEGIGGFGVVGVLKNGE